jgi:hypothetical protein
MSDEQKLRETMDRLQEDGVATVKVRDGRIVFFSKKVMQQLLAAAEEKGVEHCSIFIKASETLN